MKDWANANNLTQRHLAEMLNQSAPVINGKLNGWIAWQQRDLVRLNELFGLSSDFVLGLNAEVDVGS